MLPCHKHIVNWIIFMLAKLPWSSSNPMSKDIENIQLANKHCLEKISVCQRIKTIYGK